MLLGLFLTKIIISLHFDAMKSVSILLCVRCELTNFHKSWTLSIKMKAVSA